MEKCPICINEDRCSLRVGLKSQARRGGYVDKSLDPSKGTAGPYWKRVTWNDFVARTIKVAGEGCLHPDEVMETAEKTTREKEEAGELV
jgi:hypothetical protein